MSTPLLVVTFCASIVVMGAVIALVGVLSKPEKNQTRTVQDNSTRPPRKSWTSWIPFLAIALVIAFFTVWGSLFFLAVVLVLRMDPKPYSRVVPFPSNLDKNSAKGIYTWLFLSPFLTVPAMIVTAFTLHNYSSTNQRVFVALIPAAIHLLLLINLDSKRPFVYRHAQQAIFLVALRAGMASIALSIGTHPDDGIWLFFLGNGSLWLFGTIWARNQALRGECWWMKRKGQTILQKEETVPASEVKRDVKSSPKPQKNPEATERALIAFRSGNPESRRDAIKLLSQLGEVETF